MSTGNFKNGGTSTSLTEYRKVRAVYQNYLMQRERVSHGCQSRIQLDNIPGPVDSGLSLQIKLGENYTNCAEQDCILKSNACPVIYPSATPVAPDAPEITESISDDQTVFLTFNIPYDGGSSIQGYRISIDGEISLVNPSNISGDTITIGGLINGRIYIIAIQAFNIVGTGPFSNYVLGMPNAPSGITSPDPPEITNSVSSNGRVVLTFNIPYDGGSPIQGYNKSIDGDISQVNPSDISGNTITINGLINGRIYIIAIEAFNIAGTGSPSNYVLGTPTLYPGITPPAAPTITNIKSNSGQVVLTFTQPPNNSGSPITGYRKSVNGDISTVNPTDISGNLITINNLTNGQSYIIAIQALNVAYVGSPSNYVLGTPCTIPGIPVIDEIIPGNYSMILNFTAPNNGGSPITAYKLYVNNNLYEFEIINESEFKVNGLDNGTIYTFEISAVNSAGEGGRSSPESAMPRTTPPGLPTINDVTSTSTTLTVNFSAPVNTGGVEPVSYEYALNNDPFRPASFPQFIITTTNNDINLINGTTYQVILRAINSLGNGLISNPFIQSTLPGQPTNLSVISNSSTELTVTFTPPSGNTSLTYYYVTNGSTNPNDFTNQADVINSGDNKQFTISGLNPNTEYTIRVLAQNSAGRGAPSDPEAPGITLPEQPLIVSAISNSTTELTVIFTPPSGNTSLTYYYVTNGSTNPNDFTNLANVTDSGNNKQFTISGLIPNTEYTIRVLAENSGGRSAPSDPEVPGTTLPEQPTNLSAISNSSTEITVTFTPPSGNTSLTYYYVTNGSPDPNDFINQADVINSGGNKQFTISGLNPNTEYTIRVLAQNSGGRGAPSNSSVLVTLPGQPTDIEIGNSTTELTVMFSPGGDDTNVTYYYVTNGSTNPNDFTNLANVTNIGYRRQFTISNLNPNTGYAIRILAENSTGRGTPSDPEVPGTTLPEQPLIVSAISNTSTELTVTFTPPSGNTSLTYYYVTNGSPDPNEFTNEATGIIDSGGNKQFTISGLIPNTEYKIRVLAQNSGGRSAPSDPEVLGTTLPGQPTNVSAINNTSTELTVTFTPTGNDISLTYYYVTNGSTNPNDFINEATGIIDSGGNKQFTISGLNPNTEYTIRVLAQNSTGRSVPSDPAASGPTLPEQLTITNVIGGIQELTVYFTPPSGNLPLTYYYVTNGSPDPNEFTNEATGIIDSGGKKIFKISGLQAQTTYSICILAENLRGRGTPSSGFEGTTL